ncbi:nitronate monooxygenase family protein [Methyloversatilis sp. RAC08]|uniref:alpha-hydroxy acid oxidase n=1 Tax=Methyloversatilis sp. RAC08 TaxID=1842540 RepID=UPI00083CD8C2|nr:alpha-hydroxy acid oxidase [Methyloversatilis sp. RAC08]AOF83052.1 nitronate monooxygenase family protein [Methyloversatilis sp. RAC08]
MPAPRCIADYRELARARLHPELWHYLDDGRDTPCGRANRAAFDAAPLMPRPLTDVRGGHTRVELFGEWLAHPMLLAPLAYQRLYHPDGEQASAMAANAQDGQMVISSLASQPFDAIVRAAERAPWFQLYWQGSREATHRLLDRAIAAGIRAVMFTVDAPVKQTALALPAQVGAVNLDAPARPVAIGDGQSQVFDGWMAQAPTWDDLAWLRDRTKLPLLLKGVLHPDDAMQAVQRGCDGLVVSNHGGRVLAGAPASLSLLPTIVSAVGPGVPVLLDSGIDSGSDVHRALAAGARAVLIGRPCIWGLAGNGALGVAHVIRLLRDELEQSMALCGHATLAAIAGRSG